MDLTGLSCDHLKLGVHFERLFKATCPYLDKEKSDSKTDTGFVFSDPENLGHTMVLKFDSNFCYYGHPRFEISRHRLLNNIKHIVKYNVTVVHAQIAWVSQNS